MAVKLSDSAMLIAKQLFDEAKSLEAKAGKTLEQTDAAVARV